jgi:hypothetical protein
MSTCPQHPMVEMVFYCPACRGAKGGLSRSRAKIRAVRKNVAKASAARKKKPE